MKYIKTCPVCDTNYSTYREQQITCSKVCMGKNQTGDKNPNYGKLWSEEQKEHLSKHQKSIGTIISERVKLDWKDNENRKTKAAEVMSATIKELYREDPQMCVRIHSEDTKALIGLKSKAKFTPEFLIKQRHIMETLGLWRKLEDLTEYEIYFKEADWISRMWDIVENDLLVEHGIFNAFTNTKGCVRDHMFGRREGFRLKVPAIILRHPANCQIILNSENVKKARTNDVTKSLEDLIQDIRNYTTPWSEQAECLEAIDKYLNEKESSHASIIY